MTGARTRSFRLSGFGDEISPDPTVQLAVLAALGASGIEVRSAWGVNIVELEAERIAHLAELVRHEEMAVSAVASPIGKVDIRESADGEVGRLTHAIAAAHTLGAGYIRIFSFQFEGLEPETVRDEVIERMSVLARLAAREGVVLLLENEVGVYGDTPQRLLDVLAGVGSPALRLAWDPGNFVRVGVRPFDDAYPQLKEYVEYLQVKDAVAGQGSVPAGQGDGQVRETVADLFAAGFDGFASLEPHLLAAGRLSGFTGPRGFGRAARAFADVVKECGGELR